jgi:octaprenyl-diphosphate synthase
MLVEKQSEAQRVATNGFQEIYTPVSAYLNALDGFLNEQLGELEPEIREHAAYVFSHSGKRLRPMLVAYSGWANQSPEHNPDLVALGAVIELVHLATLVHDDILDNADIRHRQETAARKFGASTAVLVGDALFAHALTLAANFPTTEVCRVVARATSRVCAGEIAQTLEAKPFVADLNRYFRIISLKTAELFRVSSQLGARIGGYDDDFVADVARFGHHLGMAYQIFDDLTDLVGTEAAIGKTLGTDLASGKLTLPTLLLLRELPQAESAELLRYAKSGAQQIGSLFAAKMAEYKVESLVRDYFDREINQAEQALLPHDGRPPVVHLSHIGNFIRAQMHRL